VAGFGQFGEVEREAIPSRGSRSSPRESTTGALAKIEEGLAVYREMPDGRMRSDARALEKLKNSLSVTSAIVAHVLDDTPV
jgi:hypothetical protein